MQYIKARTAQMYNKATNSSGAFWNERFGSKVAEDQKDPVDYLLGTLWYVAYNPCRKGMASDPRKTYIGSINPYLEEGYDKVPVKITLHPFFIALGNTHKKRLKKFLRYEKIYLRKQKEKMRI
jgi:hypothetical protein